MDNSSRSVSGGAKPRGLGVAADGGPVAAAPSEAHDFADAVVNRLFAIAFRLQRVAAANDDRSLSAILAENLALLDESIAFVRRRSLRPIVVSD
ncbi:MAG TPA: hypothetical protein VHA73_16005 [Acidimicrobiales bacterium]|jgi:hypothetical protein|nr:hypothetical protein [Acidimicrobiales bacterium]